MKPLESFVDLQSHVRAFCETENIPALSVAVSADGEIHEAAAGTLNANTGVSATPDSVFQIGSITKVLTASAVMRLIDRSLIELDQPVKDILEDFRLHDPSMSDRITVRNLLTHTSGIPGDLFEDDSNTPGNHIESLVNQCPTLEFVHNPGEYLAYSNTGYAVAGRIVEVVLGMTWEQAITEEIYRPLGMNHAVAYPRDAIRYRAAMGHFPSAESPGGWSLAPKNFLTLGMAPAGTTLMMSARDLLKFAAGHTEATDWLSSASIAEMQRQQFALPAHAPFNATGWGLGWFRTGSGNGAVVVGHDGATLGQVSMLRVFPDTNAAVAVLVNAANPLILKKFYSQIAHLVGDEVVPDAEVADTPDGLDLGNFVGRYETVGSRSEVSLDGDGLKLEVTWDLPMPDQELHLHYVEPGCFASFGQDGNRGTNVHFLETDDNGHPRWLFSGLRLSRHVN